MCWSVENLRIMLMRKSRPNWSAPMQNAKFKDLTPDLTHCSLLIAL